MKEYPALSHMQEITKIPNMHYYSPLHSVVKPDSTTTKIRVVFDASAKTSSNLALNDILLKGSPIQDELLSILLRFRQPKYVMTADIEKMYRQIELCPKDRNFQLIFCRRSAEKPIRQYQLNTVTYGTKSARYLALTSPNILTYQKQYSKISILLT